MLFLLQPLAVAAVGREKAAFPQPSYDAVLAWRNKLQDLADDGNASSTSSSSSLISYRQDVCDRYEQVRLGNIPLRDALQGLQLRPLMRVNKFFRYTDENGIDPLDPGLMSVMMDELARRAGFTWRETFSVVHKLPTYDEWQQQAQDQQQDQQQQQQNLTKVDLSFTDLLLWSLETFDVSINWWDRTLERLEGGASFMHPWFDGSIIMVRKVGDPVIDDDSIDLWNWLRPFDRGVWIMTGATIIWSALAYQWLEYLSGHRRGRTLGQWFVDNLYLSAINFPQNYEFEPRSFAGRLFGVSISLWALLMTATYTANLASLLVDTKQTTYTVESMDDAVTQNMPLCVYENTGADDFINQKYRQARRVPFSSELETFQGLNDGLCDITVAYYQNWLGFQSQKAYNPVCDLEWVGRTVKSISSGFANAVDTGDKCTSLIGSVLDVYLNELELSGFIETMWEEHYAKSQDINCDAVSPETLAAQQEAQKNGRRRLSGTSSSSSSSAQPWYSNQPPPPQKHRDLKGAARGAAAGGAAASVESDADASTMTLNQMAGTFVLHFWLTGSAIFIGYITRYYKRNHAGKVDDWLSMSSSYFWAKYKGAPNTTTINNNTANNGDNTSTERDDCPRDEDGYAEGDGTLGKKARRRRRDMEHQHEDDDDQHLHQELQDTKQELLETRQELRETRREMHEQMGKIVELLSSRPVNAVPLSNGDF